MTTMRYSRQQMQEAIHYWSHQLELMNEDDASGVVDTVMSNSSKNMGTAVGAGALIGGALGYMATKDDEDHVKNTAKGATVGAGAGILGNAVYQNSDYIGKSVFSEDEELFDERKIKHLFDS